MRELIRVTQENQDILHRITNKRPVYSHQKWEDDWVENQQFMEKISSYPKDWWKYPKEAKVSMHCHALTIGKVSQNKKYIYMIHNC
jgi:hypothetical protein